VGVERDPELAAAFAERARDAPEISRDLAADRLAAHREFVAENPSTVNYEADHYDTRVVTQAETGVQLTTVEDVEVDVEAANGEPIEVAATHEPF
jgi:hypothetical protein